MNVRAYRFYLTHHVGQVFLAKENNMKKEKERITKADALKDGRFFLFVFLL